ncbi:hypothetical protein ACFL15_00020 [Patescibacteria group bacterium]
MNLKIPKIPNPFEKQKQVESPNKLVDFDVEKLGQKEVYLSWEALGRAEKENDIGLKFTRTFTIIGIFVGLVLVIMQEFFLILAVGSIIFVIQALTKTPPELVKYQLSNFGLLIGDDFYYWNKLKRYFFVKVDGVESLAIDTTLGFPGRLFISLGGQDKQKIKTVLDKRLYFLEEEPKTFFDTTYEKILDKFSFKDQE